MVLKKTIRKYEEILGRRFAMFDFIEDFKRIVTWKFYHKN